MDPNANLTRQRELAAEIIEVGDEGPVDWMKVSHENLVGLAYSATMLAEYVQELDTWLSRGGFRPADWVGSR